MSGNSEVVERLAHQHGVPVLSVLEFFLERAAIREYDGGQMRDEAEIGAIEDVKLWIKLWRSIGGRK